MSCHWDNIFGVEPNLSYKLTGLAMQDVHLSSSFEGLCERYTGIDFFAKSLPWGALTLSGLITLKGLFKTKCIFY